MTLYFIFFWFLWTRMFSLMFLIYIVKFFLDHVKSVIRLLARSLGCFGLKFVVMDNTVFLAQEKQVLELVKGRHDKIFDSFMLMFARTSSVYIYLRLVFTPSTTSSTQS